MRLHYFLHVPLPEASEYVVLYILSILHACEKQPPTLYQQSESNLTKNKK